MKRKIFIIIFIILIKIFSLSSQSYYENHTSYYLYFNAGVNYHFPLTTDYNSLQSAFFIDVPLNVCIDIRRSKYVSFYTGLEFAYGMNYEKLLINDNIYSFYFNSLFIRIPVIAKFYFMVDKDPAYENFYIGVGGILNFWPVNWYYTNTNDGQIHSGNSYKPTHKEAPPGNIYTPANIGLRLSIGDNFYVSRKILLGLEFFSTYLLIPPVNGYYFNQNYTRTPNDVVMEFDLSVGACFSIGIDLQE